MAQRTPVRISDVARAAGVSTATVSHALNGKGRIPPETRERVRAIARELGYRPNATARGLAEGRSRILAVTLSLEEDLPAFFTETEYYRLAVHSAWSRAQARGFALVLAPTSTRPEAWDHLPADGAAIFDPIPNDPILRELLRRELPVVVIGREVDVPAGTGCYSVDQDQHLGTLRVLDHLAERGATRVALLLSAFGHFFEGECLGAYESWCRARGAEPIVRRVYPPSKRLAFATATELLTSRDAPDAIYANIDDLAFDVLDAADALGVGVPDDLLVAGCTERSAGGRTATSLTTLSLDPRRTAAVAVDTLIDLVEGQQPEERLRLVPARLVERASTARSATRTAERSGAPPALA